MKGNEMLQYIKGPLGYSVILNGKPIGRIKDARPFGWLVSIEGFRAGSNGFNEARKGRHVFSSFKEAKAKVSEIIKET
jgi:hypothetical protein